MEKHLKIKHSKFHKICIPTLQGFELISVNEIMYLQADGAIHIFLWRVAIVSPQLKT